MFNSTKWNFSQELQTVGAVAQKELEQKTRLVHGICKRLEEEDDLRTQDVLSVSHVLVRVIQVLWAAIAVDWVTTFLLKI